MSDEWKPVFVLPNIMLKEAFGCDVAALAPANDGRIEALKQAHPTFANFLKRFADNFGQQFEPSILIVHKDARSNFLDVKAIASFRDILALSAITYGRAMHLLHPRLNCVYFGDAFAIYPWMLDRNYEHMIGSTPALLGLHEVSCFEGQSSPSLSRRSLDEGDMDRPLLDALLVRWRSHYEVADPAWEDIALMRSLNMAYHASLLPAGTDTTSFDVGRVGSLWVSAFEILVHPGRDGKANREKVFALIERTRWAIRESGNLTYDTSGKIKTKRTLASWLYQFLNERRNDFFHGNPIEISKLKLTEQATIFDYAAPLYRIALTSFLQLEFQRPLPLREELGAIGEFVVDRYWFMKPQRTAE